MEDEMIMSKVGPRISSRITQPLPGEDKMDWLRRLGRIIFSDSFRDEDFITSVTK